MNKTNTLYYKAKVTSLPVILILLLFTLGNLTGNKLHGQGVVPVTTPYGGFAVDGNLIARTPLQSPFSPDVGDFLPNENAAGNGGYVFDQAGMPVDTLTSFHVIEGYDANDADIFTDGSKFNMDPNSWVWTPGKPPGKDDINHILFFFSSDTLGNIWFVGAGDRKKGNGNTYLDFELLQNTLYQNTDGSFTSMGPDGGRTVGDLAITIEFVNGGIDPELYIYRWDSVNQGAYDFVMITPAYGTTYWAVNADSSVVVPYGAFDKYTYDQNTFTEVACNINEVVPGSYNCLDIKTVIAKTKASQSINAALKDMTAPVQVDISSSPVISVNDTSICHGDTVMLTANILSGTGPYSYLWSTGDTTQSIYVSPDTTTQYSVVVTGINGCPSDAAFATVTVWPYCDITGVETTCPLGIEQYMGPNSMVIYQWTVYGPAIIVGDSTLQMVEIEGAGYCDTTFILELFVTDTNGCESTCSMIVNLSDSISPALYGVPADTGVCCPDSIPLPADVTAVDNCDGAVPVTLTEVVSDSTGPNYFTLTRFWTAHDTCSNSVIDSMVIVVNDTLYGGGGATGIRSDEDVVLYFNVSPNPFVDATNIQFSLSRDADVSLDLYDFTGVLQRKIYKGNISAGKKVSLNLATSESMPSGMYLLVLKTPHGVKTKRVLLYK